MNRMKELRMAKKMSLRNLEGRTGIPASTLRHIECSLDATTSAINLVKISKALDTPIESIFLG